MKVLLYEQGAFLSQLVLWDGENTFWLNEMRPSSGYESLELDTVCPITGGRFTLIGEL